jgi:hypothetical protein
MVKVMVSMRIGQQSALASIILIILKVMAWSNLDLQFVQHHPITILLLRLRLWYQMVVLVEELSREPDKSASSNSEYALLHAGSNVTGSMPLR